MNLSDAIQNRRSIKRFTARPVSHQEVDRLLDAATCAPNHHLTQPWRFYVLGPLARHAYGLALGARKARKLEDAEKAAQVREVVAAEHRALPCMLAVAVVSSDNPETAEGNYAAAMMAIENIALAAVDMGLGTHIKTGAVMSDPSARAAVGLPDTERIIAIVNVGEPAEIPPPKPRSPATSLTIWVP
jgi:nitroreductase